MTGKQQVTINHGWAVYVHGQQVHGGQVVDVDPELAEHWIERGWAVEATGTTTKARPRTRRPTAPSP